MVARTNAAVAWAANPRFRLPRGLLKSEARELLLHRRLRAIVTSALNAGNLAKQSGRRSRRRTPPLRTPPPPRTTSSARTGIGTKEEYKAESPRSPAPSRGSSTIARRFIAVTKPTPPPLALLRIRRTSAAALCLSRADARVSLSRTASVRRGSLTIKAAHFARNQRHRV
ncbi:uncharacterized protein A4U43_C06F13390 [Asparagus officinalis]|uniref:Uncharacterized protein n=1 Tax=Asparagus officinalis TaxID=4686 RepID=A0A5P1EQS0_ASPOF|nr:uncharacterized protein A4U43_C06F13390 [Asparagus officinalis]